MSDPAKQTDGLAALQTRRAQRTRTIPRSQNPSTLPPYQPPAAVVDLTAEEARADDAPVPAPVAPTKPEKAKAASAPAPVAPPAKQTSSRKVGLYLDEAHEDFMFAVQAAGNAMRPRVNLTASAVVRLAMDRLMTEMSADQVRDTIMAKPADPTALGRRRR
jgi:hypothetical protein